MNVWFFISFASLSIWIVCAEIRIQRLYMENDRFKKRLVDIWIKLYDLEKKGTKNDS